MENKIYTLLEENGFKEVEEIDKAYLGEKIEITDEQPPGYFVGSKFFPFKGGIITFKEDGGVNVTDVFNLASLEKEFKRDLERGNEYRRKKIGAVVVSQREGNSYKGKLFAPGS